MRFVSLALALLPAFALSSPIEFKRAGTSLPNPLQDPFYKVPANIADYSAGQVVDMRDVETNIEGSHVGSSYQVSYRTLTTKQNPDLTVATIWTPKEPASPVKIFSYQAYEDSTVQDCVPSWAFTKPTDSQNTFVTSLDTPIYIQYALSKGWYVVAADHEGSQSAFISGRQQGQAVLDGVRALINQEKLPADSRVGLLGYSGGASATVWAENLYAQGYASELNVVGGAHGGTPIDTLNLFNFLNKSFFAGFAGAGVVGLTNAYPELNDFIQANANEEGKTALAKFQSSGYCIVPVATGNAFTDFLSYITVDDPFSKPVPKKVLSQETLLIENAATPSQVATPKFPRFIFHGLEDGIVPYADVKKYVKQQCEAGSDIAFSTLPVAEHILGEILGLVPAIAFITQALDGKAPKVVCGTSLPDINPRSQQAKQILGSDLQAQLLSLNGKKDLLGDVLSF